MGKKINIALFFGGQSVEHQVSLLSAKQVISALDRNRYNPVMIGIDQEGVWHLQDEAHLFEYPNDPAEIRLGKSQGRVVLFQNTLIELGTQYAHPIDIAFPILHGHMGEDGAIQGLFEVSGIPYVGAGVLGSAIGMDKDVMKRLLRDAGMRVTHFKVVHAQERALLDPEAVAKEMGLPFFVKPANGGSSIGVSKVVIPFQLEEALDRAFAYDRKVLIERLVVGREIECSVMGNEEPIVSLPCEIVSHGEFHSYLSKYVSSDGADFIIPVILAEQELADVQKAAKEAYRILECEGLARVDLFLTPAKEVVINEINTLPGMTEKSPYVKMWEASGYTFSAIIDRLVEYSLARAHRQKRLNRHFHLDELGAKV